MKKWTLFSVFVLLFVLPACMPAETIEPRPTPRTISLEEDLVAEELAAEAIATAITEKTQIASRVSPYVELSDDEQTFLAFWFKWNDETVFLPVAKGKIIIDNLPSCKLDSKTEIAIGELYSGLEFVQDQCVLAEKAPKNALPIIKIPGYFDNGLNLDHNSEAEAKDWNIIDLNGAYAENFVEIVTIVVENDLLGSGDLTISIYRTDGSTGDQSSDSYVIPTYMLTAESLQITFSNDQLENFEYVDDVVYALERAFTWKIPEGFSVLDLSPGDENWFVLRIRETKAGNALEEEYLRSAYIQIKDVCAPVLP